MHLLSSSFQSPIPQFHLVDLFLRAGTDFAKQKSEQKVKERNLAGISCVPLKGIEKQFAIKINLF